MYYSNITSATRTLCYKINPGVRVSILHINSTQIITCFTVYAVSVKVFEHDSSDKSGGDECREDKHETDTQNVDVVEVLVHLANYVLGEDTFI